ncbi:hypothetical protein H6G89_33235 [Oscillatoria sp. FACHB-1407]|uniref:hypothetical protein n=1 Tax=Oscillatoria sp. FACHB-1407 TaxID=2692847 RepID=UPI001688A1E6|nr:hypothetical protein [Oscillatoria sp. FACHB-1407]MBD2465855.1 hypothetical protein [Oscillatoria sp. FACHB-1407]
MSVGSRILRSLHDRYVMAHLAHSHSILKRACWKSYYCLPINPSKGDSNEP